MNIEVRAFDGSPEELSSFVVATWRSTYAGKMMVPDWSANYLRWQLQLDEPQSADHVIAAYDGDKLIGALPYFHSEFELHSRTYQASQGSWLSVDSNYRGHGVAKLLFKGMLASNRLQERAFILGYAYQGSRLSLGPKFWLNKKQQVNSTTGGRVGFWARVLDPLRAAKWNTSPIDAWLTRLSSKITPMPKSQPSDGEIFRVFQNSDADRCLELAKHSTQHLDLRIAWTKDRFLKHATGFGQCLVVENNGEVQGCITYHVLPIWGHSLEPVGIIDNIFLSELSTSSQCRFLDAVTCLMKEQGAILALKLRSGDYPIRAFLRYGWIWRPADSQIMLHWTDEPPETPPIKTKHLLWR